MTKRKETGRSPAGLRPGAIRGLDAVRLADATHAVIGAAVRVPLAGHRVRRAGALGLGSGGVDEALAAPVAAELLRLLAALALPAPGFDGGTLLARRDAGLGFGLLLGGGHGGQTDRGERPAGHALE